MKFENVCLALVDDLSVVINSDGHVESKKSAENSLRVYAEKNKGVVYPKKTKMKKAVSSHKNFNQKYVCIWENFSYSMSDKAASEDILHNTPLLPFDLFALYWAKQKFNVDNATSKRIIVTLFYESDKLITLVLDIVDNSLSEVVSYLNNKPQQYIKTLPDGIGENVYRIDLTVSGREPIKDGLHVMPDAIHSVEMKVQDFFFQTKLIPISTLSKDFSKPSLFIAAMALIITSALYVGEQKLQESIVQQELKIKTLDKKIMEIERESLVYWRKALPRYVEERRVNVNSMFKKVDNISKIIPIKSFGWSRGGGGVISIQYNLNKGAQFLKEVKIIIDERLPGCNVVETHNFNRTKREAIFKINCSL